MVMMPWQEIRNVHAASGGGDMPADKNGILFLVKMKM